MMLVRVGGGVGGWRKGVLWVDDVREMMRNLRGEVMGIVGSLWGRLGLHDEGGEMRESGCEGGVCVRAGK